eukprot:212760_1
MSCCRHVTVYVYVLILSISNSYYLSPNHLTWDQSSLFCQNWCHSELASIHNKSQNDELINTIQSGHSLFDRNSQSDAVFIGLHDDKTISNFQWIDNTPFTFANKFYTYPWLTLPPQPDSIDNINCVQIRVNNNMGWDDTACSRERRFTCNKCSGKLNKYIILKHQYEYTEANTQCQKQIGTTLATVYSKRDLAELYSLCTLYNKPSDCWITYQNNDAKQFVIMNDKSINYGNLLIQYPSNNNAKQFARINDVSMHTADINTVAHAICNVPSELCVKTSEFIAFNGAIEISDDCDAKLLLSEDNGRCDGIIYNKQYINEDRIVLIDYLFKMSDNGRGGIIIPITSCSAYYIGVSLNENDQMFVQYIEYNGSNTDYNVLPLADKNLQYSFNTTMYHLLSIQIEQIVDTVKFTIVLNNENHFEELVYQHISKIDLYSISVGIWSENSIIYGKSLYISGTPINSVLNSDTLPICMLPANPTKTKDSIQKPYGVFISITFDQILNINDTKCIIDIINHTTHTLIVNYTTIPLNCIDCDHLNIQSQNKHNQTIVNASIFVCTKEQQQQLLTALNTNEYIKTKILNDINQQYGLYISPNSTHLETDIIYMKHISTTNVIVIIDDIDSKSYVEHYYPDNQMNIMLIIIVGTLASTVVITACALLGLNCLKVHYQFKDDQYMNNRRNIEMNIYENNIALASPTVSNISSIKHILTMSNELSESGRNNKCIERKKLRSLFDGNSNVTWAEVMGDVHNDPEVIDESVTEEDIMITEGNIDMQQQERISNIAPYIVDNSTAVNSILLKDLEIIGDDALETLKCPKYAMV